jgi:hypothetical protein
MKRERIQYCPKGHNKDLLGRDKWGHCTACLKERHPLKQGAQPGNKNKKRVRFCPKGHDKDVVGRTKNYRCKQCFLDYQKEYIRKNLEKVRKYRKKYNHAYNKKNRKKCRARSKKWHKEHREQANMRRKKFAKEHQEERWANNLKVKFGITPVDYNKLLMEQKDRCAGCLRHKSKFKRKLAVDHDHKTGRVRGLLCPGCNTLLGHIKDDPDVLKRLIKYLNKNKEK